MYGAIGVAPPGAPRRVHREAVAALAIISAVVLVAAGFASSGQNRAVGMMQMVEGKLPLATLEQLAGNHGIWVNGQDLHPVHLVHNYRESHAAWTKQQIAQSPQASEQAEMKVAAAQQLAQQEKKESNFLATEEKQVGSKLAKDMRKMWSAKNPAARSRDMKQVEIMKGRFEALVDAMHKAPVLKQLPQVNSNELHVMDPRTGKVYALYEYHAPGGYEDAELNFHPVMENDLKGYSPFKDPVGRNPIYQGEYPEYKTPRQTLYEYHTPGGYEDAELNFHPVMENDLKGYSPFKDPVGRNPTYQGEYPEYKTPRQTLYEYHTPGGYEDAELNFHPVMENDLKGYSPFKDPVGRNPIYQGEYPEYRQAAGGQMLEEPWEASPYLINDQAGASPFKDPSGRNVIYQGEPPVYPEFVVVDSAGQLRLISAAQIRGMQLRQMEAAHAAEQAEWNAHESEVDALRKNQETEQQTAVKQAKPAAQHKAAKSQKVRRAMMAMTTELAQKIPSSHSRVWGAVYDPEPVRLPGMDSDPNPLTGAAKEEFSHWSTLAANVNDVYDPAKDKSAKNNFGGQAGSNWWAAQTKGNDAWWQHDHAGRGY